MKSKIQEWAEEQEKIRAERFAKDFNITFQLADTMLRAMKVGDAGVYQSMATPVDRKIFAALAISIMQANGLPVYTTDEEIHNVMYTEKPYWAQGSDDYLYCALELNARYGKLQI